VILLGAISALCAFAAAVLGSWSTERSLAVLILTAGLSLPFLLLLWLARRMCYVVHNPFIAAQASAMYFVLLLGGAFGLKYFGSLNSSTAFLSMAVTSLLVSIFILRRLGVRLTLFPVSGESSFKQILLENWEYGHWLTLTTALSWVSVQAQTFLAAGFLGLAGAGILRAMQLPSLAMSQVVAATMLIALPSMSRELGQGNLKQLRKKAILCGVSLTAMGAIFVAALFLFAVPLEKLLFAGKYASFSWLIPVLGLVPLFVGFSSGFSFALRLLRKAKFEFLAYLLSAGAALTLAFMLMPRWGLAGAAASIVGGTAVLAIAVLACFLRWGNA
jgi:O-antigen/teichoic acid export membrane protein